MTLQKVEHVVHLMLENRSFDTMLGWLYENKAPAHNIPPAAAGDKYFGLQSINLNEFTNSVEDLDISSPPLRGTGGSSIPDIHPGEEFRHVNKQLFEKSEVASGDIPTMKGYMADYVAMLKAAKYSDDEIRKYADMVMQTFTPSQLPVLNQLAQHYAVCDEWFSSVPSQTNTNRAFALTGSSHGLVDNGFLEEEDNYVAKQLGAILGLGVGDDRFPDNTLFNVLDENGHKDWKVFWETSMVPQKISNLISKASRLKPVLEKLGPLGEKLVALLESLAPYSEYLTEVSSGELSSCYSYRLYEQLHKKIADLDSHFAKTEQFHEMARAGTLPKYSYIEPFWTISQTTVDSGLKRLVTAMGNDYHPPCNLNEGENYVKSIYESLIANEEAWNKTLLIITFDEPVGVFDHVKPPAAIPPWGDKRPDFNLQKNFKFDRFGGRIPAILVSPYIEKGTVFRSPTQVPYDHTSVISTVLDWCGLGDKVADFGERTANAPKFGHILVREHQRTDAHDIGFLNRQRQPGTPVRYGDRFRLKNQHGKYLTAFKRAGINDAMEVIPDDLRSIAFDLSLFQNFPTLADDAPVDLFCQKSGTADPVEIENNDWLRIGSDERGLGSYNYLGAWKDSHDCYYFNIYLRGEHAPKQQWQIQKVDQSEGPVKFGDKVYLVNQFFDNQRLSQDSRLGQGRWLTTRENGDYWIVEAVG
ncbi:hypothetical protein SG34_008970 [Thalassomonas viridans]|uniref:Phospholipase C n=1 Tax=Thalassomonas viridans TaxID=137584 RepID=A0AAE9Z817_9GAMM|nr:alkaline phosphatase family protein [Thalassomonas viridans]WDE06998.1 hypothetical protein SG34_008970 [Thalassomonas viridans]